MAAICFVAFVWTYGQSIRPSRSVAEQAARQHCENRQNRDCETLVAEVRAALAAEASADLANQQLWLNIIGLIGLAGTVLYARAAYIASMASAKAARDTLDHAELATERQLRPYVYISRGQPLGRPLTYQDRLGFLIKNYGQTPAHKVRIRRGALRAKRPLGNAAAVLSPNEDVFDLAPGGELPMLLTMSDFSEKEFRTFVDDGPDVYLFRVRVEYEYAPGKLDAHDATFVIGEQAAEDGWIPMLSRRERLRKPKREN